MSKRTVLAFVLIFLVYLGSLKISQMLVKPAPAPLPETAATGTGAGADSGAAAAAPTAVSPAGAEGTADAVAAGARPATSPAPDAEDPLRFVAPEAAPAAVEVRSDLYVLRLDPRGARPVSWQGRAFKGPQGEDAVQLVPADAAQAEGTEGDAVVGTRGRLALGGAIFTPDDPGPIEVERAGGPRKVVFTARTAGGLLVRKTYTFEPGRYDVGIELEVAGLDAAAAQLARQELGDELRASFAWTAGIASTERNKRLEASGFRSFAGVGADLFVKPRRELRSAGDVEKARATLSGSVRFAGVQNKYFTIAGIVPESHERAVEGVAHLDADRARQQQTWWIELPMAPGKAGGERQGAARLLLYMGPSEYGLLKTYGVGLEKAVDLGWKMIQPIAAFILWLMGWMHKVVPNYGLVIILLSVVTKLAFYPLTLSSTRSMKRLQEVQPRLKALQEKHKNNQQKLGEEMMKLYREERINPMGGCLPLLLQMPVFFALYQVLRGSIALRQAPFVAWIKDLGEPDTLFHLPFSLPFLGNEFNLLPFVMAATTYWQMKVTPTPPTTGPSLQLMNKLMPFMMMFFFYHFPSGLVLYWTVVNLLTIHQTWHIHRTTPAAGGAQA